MENRIIKKTPSIKQKEKGVETDLKQTQVMHSMLSLNFKFMSKNVWIQ